MDFPPIPEDFGSKYGASFDFDDFLYGIGDAETVQSGVGTSDTAGAMEAVGTIGKAPSNSWSDSCPPRLSRGDPIPVVHILETYTWINHHHQVNFYPFTIFIASLVVMLA